MVLAPGRFSISTGWPHASLILWPIRRATMSLGPPGGNGTMIRIGRLGKLAALLLASGPSWPWAKISREVESSATLNNSSACFMALLRVLSRLRLSPP
jgi:hypothetical protein